MNLPAIAMTTEEKVQDIQPSGKEKSV